ncbi:hypothetical protein PPHE_a1900 [Pseudoalteromonas phenolica O-BC30]|nr:hypothetical protein [Pseudoalteromonas phenolica O-BC30]
MTNLSFINQHYAWLLGCLAAWLLGCLAAWLLGLIAVLVIVLAAWHSNKVGARMRKTR